MKFVVSVILTIIMSFTSCLFFPWWSIVIIAFLIAILIPQGPGKSFLTGFLALFIFWTLLSFWISTNNDHILAHRVSMLLFKKDSPPVLIIVTGLIGGLVAGFGAMTGSYARPRTKFKRKLI